MRVRARTVAIGALCLAWTLTAAGCVSTGGDQPTPPPIDLPTLATASPTPNQSPAAEDELLAGTKNSIVRIEGVDCAGTYQTGTGFFVQPGLIATAYHVVEDQQSIAVRTLSTRTGSDHVFAAEVVGFNESADVALVRVDDDDSEVLAPAATDPAVNSAVVSIGYPKGLPLGLETGRITAVDQDIVVVEGEDRRPLSGVLRFTAPASAATGGGPLVDGSGAVVGLVDSGFTEGSQVHYAVPGTTVKALTDGFAASPEVQPPPDCPSPSALPDTDLTVKSKHPDAPGIATSVEAYFGGINAGEQTVDDKQKLTGYEVAYAQLSGERLTAYPTLDKFSVIHHQRISNVVLQSVEYVDDTTDTVRLSYDYVTINDNGGQSACHKRSMEYTMSIDTGGWTFADETVRKRVSC